MSKNKSKSVQSENTVTKYIKQYANKNFLIDLIFETRYLHITCWFILMLEIFINVFIIHKVEYTEIDWVAYMQEVEGFLNGTRDYKLLRGNTGPLVYPAGFVYIYSILYILTSQGHKIVLAQYIFLVLYIAQLYFYLNIYKKTAKVPPYALVISTLTSYRIHSIYVLRLFNDPVAVLLFYISLNFLLRNKWLLGSLFYSLAVSIKMNILLYSPCLLLLYLTNLSLSQTFINLLVCAVVQLVLGAPFLYNNPVSYIWGSFDVGRIFEHTWTVNYRFLSRSTFESRYFHISLLVLHISLLLLFLPLFKKYLGSYAKLNCIAQELQASTSRKTSNQNLHTKRNSKLEKHIITQTTDKSDNYEISFDRNAQLMVLPFFATNLIGIACARSLHYQFYSWYFHSLLYLSFCTKYKKPFLFLLLGIIELCWNTYPSTNVSSALLHVCHVILLTGVYNYMKN